MTTAVDERPRGRIERWMAHPVSWLAWFALLAIWRSPNFDLPPNYGATLAMCREADYLARTDFDYYALRYAEPTHYQHGNRVYMTSFVPSLVALGMRFAPSPATNLIWFHCLGIAAATVIGVGSTALAARWVHPGVALLATATALTFPAMVVQMDNAGMDLFLGAFVVASALAVAHERWLLASLLIVLGFLAKSTGMVHTLALALSLAWLALWGWRGSPARRQTAQRFAVVLLAAALVGQYALIRWGGTMNVLFKDLGAESRSKGLAEVLLFTPEFAALSLAILGWYAWRSARLVLVARRGPETWAALGREFHADRVALVLAVGLLGMYLAGEFFEIIPRYQASMIPAAMILLTMAVRHWSPRWAAACFALLIVVNLTDVEQRFWRHWVESGLRRGALEAGYDQSSIVRTDTGRSRAIAEKYRDLPLLAMGFYESYLMLPTHGCVERPLQGYAVDNNLVPGLKNRIDLLIDQPDDVVVVVAPIALAGEPRVPDPVPGDEILFREPEPDGSYAYRKRWSNADARRGEILDWYLSWLQNRVEPEVVVAALLRAGREADAWSFAARREATASTTLAKAGGLLVERGDLPLADKAVAAALARQADNADAVFILALIQLRRGELQAAVDSLQRSLAIEPGHEHAAKVLASILLQARQPANALAVLRSATRHNLTSQGLWEDYLRRLQELLSDPQTQSLVRADEMEQAEQRLETIIRETPP
ncbi:MAG: hypothetical protein K1X74_06790 [Pirellulales bacterium]|nr:hypothetical protein [Pirellulales bacterium]